MENIILKLFLKWIISLGKCFRYQPLESTISWLNNHIVKNRVHLKKERKKLEVQWTLLSSIFLTPGGHWVRWGEVRSNVWARWSQTWLVSLAQVSFIAQRRWKCLLPVFPPGPDWKLTPSLCGDTDHLLVKQGYSYKFVSSRVLHRE